MTLLDMEISYFQILAHQASRNYLYFILGREVYHVKTALDCISLLMFSLVLMLASIWVHLKGICPLHCLRDGLVMV